MYMVCCGLMPVTFTYSRQDYFTSIGVCEAIMTIMHKRIKWSHLDRPQRNNREPINAIYTLMGYTVHALITCHNKNRLKWNIYDTLLSFMVRYTVGCRYNAVTLGRPLGRGLGCLLWIQTLTDTLSFCNAESNILLYCTTLLCHSTVCTVFYL